MVSRMPSLLLLPPLLLALQAMLGVMAEQDMTLWAESRTGGAIRIAWMLTPAWTEQNSIADITAFDVLVNDQTSQTVNASTAPFSTELAGLPAESSFLIQVLGRLRPDATASTAPASNVLATSTLAATPPAQPPAAPEFLAAGGGVIRIPS
ncbi:hypothetical protein P43SY_001511 [Pythium insidiosum]|uniref:Secreted protein n=1 Tax=Pythium insidiosum TaxID=114742 RepID=A0AAD5Q778_PYTIN|nr:hypothetical protein P43SY_001511 [Pythium insidiosum]